MVESPQAPMLVVGGARSGKSRWAEQSTLAAGRPAIYIATALAHDDEMRARIETHRDRRGADWQTVEEPLELVDALSRASLSSMPILVDCLTLWLSNLLFAERDIEAQSARLVAWTRDCRQPVIFVANEVGLGIVPDNALARRFRDDAGHLNQAIASACKSVYFVAAGLPLKLK